MNDTTGWGETPAGTDPLAALWALWLKELPFLRSHARALVSKSGHNVDDLIDEALVRAVSATLRGGGPQKAPRAWLKLLLDHTFIDQFRRSKRFEDPEKSGVIVVVADSWPTPECELLSRERRRLVVRALARLPEALRRAFVLRVVEGRSYRAIARSQDTTVTNARKRVQLARAALRQQGEPDTGCPPRLPASSRKHSWQVRT